MTGDTIYALSSGALPAAIAIVRVSGPAAEVAAERLAGQLPEPRSASLRRLRAADGAIIDEALLLRFPAPNTATGEPLVELHLHGGRAVVARLLDELSTMPGLREAEPGEFTRRALINSRLDLTQAEGLADLLSAETEWQRRAAIESAGGALRRQVEGWRDRLIALSARAEAAIDYVGDEDETALDEHALGAEAAIVAQEMRAWLVQPAAELLTNGVKIVLAGPPNSGKSSLFNALVGAEKAIVTSIPGTTRDIIEARIDFDGLPANLLDTAGLRASDDTVEQIGVERAFDALSQADIVLWLGNPEDAPVRSNVILIHSRADERVDVPEGSIATSVRTSTGTAKLRSVLLARLRALLPPFDQAALNRRQRHLLSEAADALTGAIGRDLLIVAESLRQSLASVDVVLGRNSTEEVMDALFGRFCLGK
ncbi:tRNA uridine-5-carboxymethylaminomethyl(34) synthesis GTPase MnmE [Sphingomonas humi]|uniref:tRNA modification GTPase MnmE n=1 Tax=Sphingomonas humi TaxID=335630 RepID=A0ABP7RKD8_9SPHN